MATVSKEIADNIIANDGYYEGDRSSEGDPRVVRIVRYNNMFDGGEAFGLIYAGEDLDRYHNAAACHNPTTIFDATDA